LISRFFIVRHYSEASSFVGASSFDSTTSSEVSAGVSGSTGAAFASASLAAASS